MDSRIYKDLVSYNKDVNSKSMHKPIKKAIDNFRQLKMP